ncbi:MAG: hypothetical protein M3003_08255 [Candidatus Dormibacteraeota bacterium]|nr:hypothetical protein [Candidatus Dormibacteraeota bacterium]
MPAIRITANVPDLVTVFVATKNYGTSRATVFRMLPAYDLVRYRRRGPTATIIDRRQLERLLRPRPAK